MRLAIVLGVGLLAVACAPGPAGGDGTGGTSSTGGAGGGVEWPTCQGTDDGPAPLQEGVNRACEPKTPCYARCVPISIGVDACWPDECEACPEPTFDAPPPVASMYAACPGLVNSAPSAKDTLVADPTAAGVIWQAGGLARACGDPLLLSQARELGGLDLPMLSESGTCTTGTACQIVRFYRTCDDCEQPYFAHTIPGTCVEL